MVENKTRDEERLWLLCLVTFSNAHTFRNDLRLQQRISWKWTRRFVGSVDTPWAWSWTPSANRRIRSDGKVSVAEATCRQTRSKNMATFTYGGLLQYTGLMKKSFYESGPLLLSYSSRTIYVILLLLCMWVVHTRDAQDVSALLYFRCTRRRRELE